jgi:hypothetical protein
VKEMIVLTSSSSDIQLRKYIPLVMADMITLITPPIRAGMNTIGLLIATLKPVVM